MLIKLQSNHPIDSRPGFQDYDGKVYKIDPPATWDAWCAWAERALGFKVDRRPTASRMIDGVPHFFPKRPMTGVHCVRAVRAPKETV